MLLGGLALIFVFLTSQVVVDSPLRRVDERLGLAIADSRRRDAVIELLVDLGSITVAVPVLVVVLAYIAWRAHRAGTPGWWLPPLAALVIMTAVPALVVPLKEALGRTGPPGMVGDRYYPSGHTATAAVAYGAAVLLLLPWLRSAYVRRELTIGCPVLVLAVGFGLVRRGFHWPLDVVASLVLSAMLLITLTVLLDRLAHGVGVGRTDARRQGSQPSAPRQSGRRRAHRRAAAPDP